jgi:hypothetical protein
MESRVSQNLQLNACDRHAENCLALGKYCGLFIVILNVRE